MIFVGYEKLTVFLSSLPFGYVYYARTFTPRSIRPSFNMFWNVIDQHNYLGIGRFSHLDIPIKYQNLTGITNMISIGSFFDTIIGVDYGYSCIHLHTGQTLVQSSTLPPSMRRKLTNRGRFLYAKQPTPDQKFF